MKGICEAAIHWNQFSWEAFATLATGFLAVGAAFYVGRKQLAILKKQTELQELQTDIQHQAVQADLFDRRYAVYDRVQSFLQHIVQTSCPPDGDIQRNFLIAKGEANLLFSQRVIDGLQEIWAKSCDLHALNSIMNHAFATEGHYGDGNPQREADLFSWFCERLTSLPALFAEMKLGRGEIPPPG